MPLSEVSSDLTVAIEARKFSVHKFPLVSRCGVIRKLLSEAINQSWIELQDIPGGAEAFDLAAKFCYGDKLEITLENVAMLRCAAQYLEMTQEIAENNLEIYTESYLNKTVFPTITNSITVLHTCSSLLPVAEEINLIGRLIQSIASAACNEQVTSGFYKLEHNITLKTTTADTGIPSNWWGKSLAVLNLEFFEKVVSAMRSKGLNEEVISKVLINYTQDSLQDLVAKETKLVKEKLLDPELQNKRCMIVETIGSLLPTQSRKDSLPIAFLSGLMKIATMVSASVTCRLDLERRIGLQLDQAILKDILIPVYRHGKDEPLYETDSILRIFSIFLNFYAGEDEIENLEDESDMGNEYDSPRSPKQSMILKVSKLMDSYLAEIALDSNLVISKFIALAELVPDHARAVTDGLYRAVDLFLKVHPTIEDSERYRLCKIIDCQKLSQEAWSHAAQNERLPVQMAVQVLYFEQIRLRNAMNGGHTQFFYGSANGYNPQRSGSIAGSGAVSPRDNYASVRRENRELRLEVARMKMRLTELEKDHVYMKQEMEKAPQKNKFLRSFTNKLSKFNAFFRLKDKHSSGSRFSLQKRRRHSIS